LAKERRLIDANGRAVRPTLYDLLVHRAIDYFANTRSHLSEPINAFVLDNPDYWQSAKGFSQLDIPYTETSSRKYQVLKLYQSIIQYHLKSKVSAALVDLEIKRFKYLRQHASLRNKDELYLTALEALSKTDAKKGGAELAQIEIARYYQQKGDFVKAHALAELIQEKYPNTNSSINASSIIKSITMKSLSVSGESVYGLDKSILVKVDYGNLKKVYFKIIKMDEEKYDKYNRSNANERIEYLNSLEVIRARGLSLPDYGDYKSHSAEFFTEGLGFGRYAMIVSDDSSFEKKENSGSGIMMFQVSNLGMWNRNTTEGKTSIVVDGWNVAATAKSDQDGFILPKLSTNNSYRVVLRKGNDAYYSDQNLYEYNRNNRRAEHKHVTFFTDRRLYRPGQMIHFKGLAVEKNENGIPSILASTAIEITFKDANYQDVEKQTFSTNEYGTFHGTFTAPEGGLTGSMSITSSIGGRTDVQVEEYKRPTFEVLVDTIKTAYQPGDDIGIAGIAQAYAGFGIDNAAVNVRVTKEQRFWCYPWWRRGWFPNNSGTEEVYQTSLETDADGKYNFSFKSDEDTGRDRFAYFQYVIHVDVTNQAGETRTEKSSFSLSKTPFAISTSLLGKNDVNQLKSLTISTKNFNDQPITAQGIYRIIPLISPEQTFIERYWERPDSILIDEASFKAQFPHLAYRDEDELANWKTEEAIAEGKFTSGSEIEIAAKEWGGGYYKLVTEAIDEKGRKQELESYFELFDLDDPFIPYNATLWTHFEDKGYSPGDKVNFHIGTAEDQVHVLFEVSKWGELVVSKWVNVKDLDKEILSISERDRGNLIAQIHYAKHNRSHEIEETIKIPWTNKDLDIKLSSFRDKTKPGSEETWTISVNHPELANDQTELVAAMYDASLDAILPHQWGFSGYPSENYASRTFRFAGWNQTRWSILHRSWPRAVGYLDFAYPSLNFFGYHLGYGREIMLRGKASGVRMNAPAPMIEEASAYDEVAVVGRRDDSNSSTFNIDKKPRTIADFDGQVRENLDETVFFFPQLQSKNGQIEFSFKMNDALTRWKFMAFGHTTDLAYGITEALITTQKELMVIPHLPRFLRQGDEITITSSVKNLSEATVSGEVQLKVIDAITGEDLNEVFHNHQPIMPISLDAGLSKAAKWLVKVPEDHVTPVRLEVIAVAGEYSDGQIEEVPVVTNRTLVTETLPLWINGNQDKDFVFESLLKSSDSKVNHNYSVEFTSNPVWYAVQALPYMMEYPYDCTEQVWNRYYAHALGLDIINQFPQIKAVMTKWKDTDALLSNLQKNQELKSALLKDTPWVMDALSEEEQKKNVALLFDLVKMERSQSAALQSIIQRQGSDGGFAWFTGGRSNVYISQYILEGLGRLNQLDVKNSARDKELNQLVARTIDFIDGKIAERYQRLLKLDGEGKIKLSKNQLTSLDVHYLYARSFFPGRRFSEDARKAFFYYKDQAKKYWVEKSIYDQSMIGISLYQFDEKESVEEMMISLKERAIESEELGVYWKYNRGYHWSQAPIESQAKLITLYELMDEDSSTVDGLKKWLLKNKQTNRWNTTKSTAAAIHALLLSGNRWIENDQPVEVTIADRLISSEVDQADAGSGYWKKVLDIEIIDDTYANVSVSNPNNQPAFGSVYHQYWEDMDEVADFQDTPLKLMKAIFRKVNTPAGPELESLSDSDQLEVGDLVTIRIILEVDRAMEFVHMKDSRSSGLEPINVLSQYKWQDGLGYYESTKDLSTDFFFDRLNKGKYVFEYPLRVSHSGQFSNGITTIQCMYAPEFTSHSNGVSLTIE